MMSCVNKITIKNRSKRQTLTNVNKARFVAQGTLLNISIRHYLLRDYILSLILTVVNNSPLSIEDTINYSHPRIVIRPFGSILFAIQIKYRLMSNPRFTKS